MEEVEGFRGKIETDTGTITAKIDVDHTLLGCVNMCLLMNCRSFFYTNINVLCQTHNLILDQITSPADREAAVYYVIAGKLYRIIQLVLLFFYFCFNF